MRITYLHQYFTTPESAGGTRSYEFARRLVRAGHAVTIVTSDAFLSERFRTSDGLGHYMVEGVRVVVLPVPYRNEMRVPARVLSYMRFAVRACWIAARIPADVVIATSTPLTIAIPGLLARVRQRCPLVFEVRDLWPELPIALGALRSRTSRGLARLLEWIAYHGSSHVIALSPGMVDGVRARGVAEDKITCIPNACDIDAFAVPEEAGEPIRASVPGLSEDGPLVVYAGTMGRVNGVEYLADVAASTRRLVPNARFLLVGDGYGREQLTARARELGVLGQTLFVWDPVPKSSMPALFAASTVVVSLVRPAPEMWANSANKFFDGLAAGRPLVINYGGWQADMLAESGAGISVPGDDAQAAAELLAAFLGDHERVATAREAARKLARRFDRDELAAQFIAVVEAEVGSRKGTRA